MPSKVSVLIKNSFLFTVAPFLPKVINILLMPVMTKYLTDVDFGISGTISSYSQAIGAFSTLGLSIVLMNCFYKNPVEYKQFWRQIYGFLNIWMVFFAVTQAVLLYFVIPEEAIENRWWIIILTNFSTVLFGPTSTIGSTYYLYNKQAFPIVWRSVVASVMTVIVDFVLIVYLRWGYMGWYVGTFAGTFFSNATYWYVVNFKLGLSPCYHIDFNFLKHSLAVSLPTIPHSYSSYLLEGSGRMVLDRYKISQAEIGRVSVAQLIGGLFYMGMTGLNQAISPFFMESIKNGREDRLKLLCHFYVIICFGLAFTISIWSKEIFDVLMSNDTLKKAYPLAIAYIMAICYRPLYVIASNYYFYYEKTKHLLQISFVSGLIALLLYILFTPLYGIWGLLAGYYIASLYYGYSGFFFRPYKEYAKNKYPHKTVFIIQLIITALAFYVVEYMVAKIVITILFIAASYYFFRRYAGLLRINVNMLRK